MSLLSLNRQLAVDLLVDFVREETRKFGFEKVVVGLSGGIDSALSAAIATRALGSAGVVPVAMPHADSDPASLTDGQLVADQLGLTLRTIDITEATAALARALATDDRVGLGNVKARVRMTVLFEVSRQESALVLGTSNKTELLLGYGTLFGDMASALNPIGDLYKMQVFALAEEMALSARVREKAPSADLWSGQTDEGELGFSYAEVDEILVRMIDRRATNGALVADGFQLDLVERVRSRVRGAQYKRCPPILAKVGLRTLGTDFLYQRDWGR